MNCAAQDCRIGEGKVHGHFTNNFNERLFKVREESNSLPVKRSNGLSQDQKGASDREYLIYRDHQVRGSPPNVSCKMIGKTQKSRGAIDRKFNEECDDNTVISGNELQLNLPRILKQDIQAGTNTYMRWKIKFVCEFFIFKMRDDLLTHSTRYWCHNRFHYGSKFRPATNAHAKQKPNSRAKLCNQNDLLHLGSENNEGRSSSHTSWFEFSFVHLRFQLVYFDDANTKTICDALIAGWPKLNPLKLNLQVWNWFIKRPCTRKSHVRDGQQAHVRKDGHLELFGSLPQFLSAPAQYFLQLYVTLSINLLSHTCIDVEIHYLCHG